MTDERPLRIGILETGAPPEELIGAFGDYTAMVRAWLAPLRAQFTAYSVMNGVLPDDPAECDLWVITGSRYGAYEDHAWIPPLEAFIRAARAGGRKMIGICFGHQIIAQALGGVVRRSDKGWGLGVHSYRPVNWPAQLGPEPDRIALQSFHQDQVETLPEGARRIGTSAFCENAALWYPGFALTVQGHPEFSGAYVRDLLDLRAGSVLSERDVEQGRRDLDRPVTAAALADLVRERIDRI